MDGNGGVMPPLFPARRIDRRVPICYRFVISRNYPLVFGKTNAVKLPEFVKIATVKVGRFLSESFPGCDVLLIVRPHGGDAAFSISSVNSEKSYYMAQEFIDRNGTWQDVPADNQTIN